MLLTQLLPAFVLVSTASASIFGGKSIRVSDEPLPVPGANPLLYCNNPDDYILTIDNVDLDPNPPTAGNNLTITATGSLSEDVEDGATINIQVKYGLIKILSQQFDLCAQADKADQACPIKKGDVELKKEVALPRAIPPGKYTVLADVLSKDDRVITCLTASVIFKTHGLVSNGDDL